VFVHISEQLIVEELSYFSCIGQFIIHHSFFMESLEIVGIEAVETAAHRHRVPLKLGCFILADSVSVR
jgi:hypothetical protein